MIAHWRSKLCSIKDLAQRYNISYQLAHKLTRDFKKNPDFLVQLRCKEQMRDEKVEAISKEVNKMVENRTPVWSSLIVGSLVKQN